MKGSRPDEVFAERREGLFLIVTEHLEDDGLGLDVLHEGLCHLHCDLTERKGNTTQTRPEEDCL